MAGRRVHGGATTSTTAAARVLGAVVTAVASHRHVRINGLDVMTGDLSVFHDGRLYCTVDLDAISGGDVDGDGSLLAALRRHGGRGRPLP